MKLKRLQIFFLSLLSVLSLLMVTIPHHHHESVMMCFVEEECEADHAINDEHTNHSSDEDHPDSCLSSGSFLPQNLLKILIGLFSLALLFRHFGNYSIFVEESKIHHVLCFCLFHCSDPCLCGIDGRGPPVV